MRRTQIIAIVIILVIAAGVALYYFLWAPRTPGGQVPAGTSSAGGNSAATNQSSTVIPVPNTPVPASSYGKGAETSTTAAPSAVGILEGTAKPAPGAKVNLAAVQVSVSDPKTGKVLATTAVGAGGVYKFTVAPGEYVLNIVRGTGTSSQLPQRIYVGANQIINVNFFVST
jgi:hypothetical protein